MRVLQITHYTVFAALDISHVGQNLFKLLRTEISFAQVSVLRASRLNLIQLLYSEKA